MEDQEGSFRTKPPEERALPEGQCEGARRVQESTLPSRNLNHQNSLSICLCSCDTPVSSPLGPYPVDGYTLELLIFIQLGWKIEVSDYFGQVSDLDEERSHCV